MDGRAFYENVKSFCQSRGGPYVNVQQHHHRRGRRPVRGGAVAVTAASASSAFDAVAQNRFT